MKRYFDRLRGSCLIIALVGITVFGLRASMPPGPAAARGDALSALPALPAAGQHASTQEAVRQLKQQGQYDSLMAAVQKARYSPQPVRQAASPVKAASYSAANAANGFGTWFAPEAVHVRPKAGGGDWEWSVRLTGYGYGENLQRPALAEPLAREGRVEYRRGTITEWYVNDARGLEQGFTLAEPPPGRAEGSQGRLTLTMAIADPLEPRLDANAGAVKFVDPQGHVQLHFAGLKAWDAAGRELPSEMQASDGQIALLVDDHNATYPVTIDPLIFAETKLTASDAAAGDRFGNSVAISGDTVVVGAYLDDGAGSNSGSAYVFVRSGLIWTQQRRLTAAPDAAEFDEFGISVAISGDTVVVGALFDDDGGSDSGSAYVFVRSGSNWTRQQKLTASDAAAGDRFGNSVAISGDTVVVGAYLDDGAGSNSGSAYVFVRSGPIWTQQEKLTALDAAAGDGFGSSVAISGDTVVVGAPFDDGVGFKSGSAYVYQNASNADLLMSLGVDKTSVRQGDLLTYTLTVRNFGPNLALGVVVNDTLSSGTTFVNAHANKGTFTAPPTGQTGTVTWLVGHMAISDREDAQIRVTVIARGRTTITNTATVGSYFTSDPNGANNSASITVSVSPGGKK